MHAVDLGADEWGDIVYLGLALGEKVWKCGIGVLAVVIVLEELQRRVSIRHKSVIVHTS